MSIHFTATYSPDDNKLRLYATSRLDPDLYQRVKNARFQWAPKQECFYATWNPTAEDLAIELAGEIEDDDKSLTDRAEERAERFQDYQGKRAQEADRARSAVSEIADNIPFGQPILVGHHSQRRAEKDVERIQNGIRKALKLWETSEYWSQRAAGALRHAKYLEKPQVRARRIKTIEAEQRKMQREQLEADKWLKAWSKDGLTLDEGRAISNQCPLRVVDTTDGTLYWSAWDVLRPDEDRYKACPAYTVEQVQEVARRAYPKTIARAQRWIDHYNHRLAYEKAMLEEQGASALIAKQPRPTQLPLLNYRGTNGVIVSPNRYRRGEIDTLQQVDMNAAQYAKIWKDYKGTIIVENSHRMRVAMVNHARVAVFITDSKTHSKPEPIEVKPRAPALLISNEAVYKAPTEPDARAGEFAKLKELAANGVEVVSCPDLFVTPPDLARRVAEVADIQPGHTVLEPSAGTGALMSAAKDRGGIVQGVEINCKMVDALTRRFDNVFQGDFLVNCGQALGKFDRIIMNPPFSNQADIKHVSHALSFLKEGGKLVAIMAAGVSFRQDRLAREFRDRIDALGGTFEPLPADSFKQSGTGVNTVLLQVSL